MAVTESLQEHVILSVDSFLRIKIVSEIPYIFHETESVSLNVMQILICMCV